MHEIYTRLVADCVMIELISLVLIISETVPFAANFPIKEAQLCDLRKKC